MKSLMKKLFKSPPQDTFYNVNRDGRLVLDKEGLLKSGRMQRQLDAARDLKNIAEASVDKEK